jgi:hypothetical protein
MTGGESESPETAVKDSAPRAEPVVSLQVGPWATVLVLLLAMAAYVDCLSYQFVWDDVLMLVQTQNLRDLRNLPQFLWTDFSTITSGAIEGGYYRPTLAMSLTLETKLWGLTPAPLHLTNLLLHVLATFLVSRLVLAMGGTSIAALFATLIFAIHPVHVEAVVWVAARQELLMTIGVLGCILSYQRWKVPGRWRALAGVAALLSLTLALLSKEPAVVLPALLVLSDVTAPSPRDPTQGPAMWRPALRRSLPFWFVTAARYFRQASEIHPDRAQPVRALALLAEGQGQRAEGLNYWRRVIELAPNGEAVREAVSHIRRLEREVGAPETAPLGSDPPGT